MQAEGRDLFLVDSGDRRFGHGLTDRLMPGTGNGQLVLQKYLLMGYDVVCPGNHDIENRPVVEWTKENLVKAWKGTFLTSNVRLNTTTKFDSRLDTRPFYGSSHRYWTTKKTKQVVSPKYSSGSKLSIYVQSEDHGLRAYNIGIEDSKG
ncbi:hypothetical protein FS749_002586 [Ceratobasidium sp. UAMH 11750]|nr:hypothetical protein FS749_002586 [Ceratobasidium sp. UAMH 11750]